ncbi:MAG: putative hydroxymethylpyrimidine transport system permease protein [Solirubrobacteraceae bacterium]|jgi:ABC-type nitrate/sulfonate/bicarbonate transport system permease component|nr:putative hydroxymethylpyrimidine transport system permease protein [Solirubrobacteraceae bacterium]
MSASSRSGGGALAGVLRAEAGLVRTEVRLWSAAGRLLLGWRTLLVLAALLGAWELYVDLGGADRLILPPPHQVASSLYDDRSLLWSNFLVTAREIVVGILVAAAAGLALAVSLHLSRTLRRAVYPLLVASQAIPIVLVAPLLVLWLGFGFAPKLVVIAIVCFFPIVVTTIDALAAVDPDLLKLMRTFDSSRARTFRHVELPAALPGLFTGMKIAVVFAPIGAVFAEQAGSNSGLGYVFEQAIPQLLTARAYAAVLILAAFAIALFTVLNLAERLLLPWAYEPRGEIPQ